MTRLCRKMMRQHAARRSRFAFRLASFPTKMKAKYVPVSLAPLLPPRSHCNRKSSKPPSDAHSSTPSRESANLRVSYMNPERCSQRALGSASSRMRPGLSSTAPSYHTPRWGPWRHALRSCLVDLGPSHPDPLA